MARQRHFPPDGGVGAAVLSRPLSRDANLRYHCGMQNIPTPAMPLMPPIPVMRNVAVADPWAAALECGAGPVIAVLVAGSAPACRDPGAARLLRYSEGAPLFDLKPPCGGALEGLLRRLDNLAPLRPGPTDLSRDAAA